MLDGFPRNETQANKLDEYLDGQSEPINNVIEFKVSIQFHPMGKREL